MWKDFFSFNKRERITLMTLTIAIVVVQLFIWTKDTWVRWLPKPLEQRYDDRKLLIARQDSVTRKTVTIPAWVEQRRTSQKRNLQRIPFNPNTVDSATLSRFGVRSYVIKNWMNYRRKGGRFRKDADLARIYGLQPAVYEELKPWIRLETAESGSVEKKGSAGQPAPTDAQRTEMVKPMDAAPIEPISASLPVGFELNSSDTSRLKQIKGVGSSTAYRIERYRNQLGGFYTLSQLAEIKGIYPETLARLQEIMTVDPNRIRRIDANRASLEKLQAHPYLSFYQAKVIVELRKAKGNIRSVQELQPYQEFTTEDLERLRWYLSF
jgi:DNA uptake protein ComE-like DNA-binding protein